MLDLGPDAERPIDDKFHAKVQRGARSGLLEQGGGRSLVLSRSMRISVPFPYARISTASLSIWASVKPSLRLMIFNNYVKEQGCQFHRIWRRGSRGETEGRDEEASRYLRSGGWDKEGRTVLVMPSVNRTNSILFSGPSQSGKSVRMSRRAVACESAGL